MAGATDDVLVRLAQRGAASRTAATRAGSNGVGGKYQNSLTTTSSPPLAAAALSQACRSSRSITLSTASSGWRKSTVKKTRPGIVLRDSG